jgi:DNA-binding transcriptional MerR regulator
MTIVEASQKAGLSVHTLRYYEQEGILLSPIDRNDSGRRAYSDKDVAWIINCAKFPATGMPIAQFASTRGYFAPATETKPSV